MCRARGRPPYPLAGGLLVCGEMPPRVTFEGAKFWSIVGL